MARWKQIDKLQQPPFRLDLSQDQCVYAREYVSHGGFNASVGNNKVANFKKHPSKKGLPEWRYKIGAIKEFALEVEKAFQGGKFTVATIPTSKVKGSPEYDDRFDQMIVELKRLNPRVFYEEPIVISQNAQSASSEGGSREPYLIEQMYEWQGFSGAPPKHLIVIDDVITTGGHFKAYKNFLLSHHPEIQVVGMFWALTVWKDDEDEGSPF